MYISLPISNFIKQTVDKINKLMIIKAEFFVSLQKQRLKTVHLLYCSFTLLFISFIVGTKRLSIVLEHIVKVLVKFFAHICSLLEMNERLLKRK